MITLNDNLASARSQFRLLFRSMINDRWNLVRTPDGGVSILRALHAKEADVLVRDVQAYSEDRLIQALHNKLSA